MGRISNAAAFIKANMPLGLPGTLTDQQAWGVALYMNSHERPQDPRYTGNVQGTRHDFHSTEDSMYGRVGDGERPNHPPSAAFLVTTMRCRLN